MEAQQWRELEPGDRVYFKKVLTVIKVKSDRDGDTATVVFTDEDGIEYEAGGDNLRRFLDRSEFIRRPVPARSSSLG